jgi:hypothetical protein
MSVEDVTQIAALGVGLFIGYFVRVVNSMLERPAGPTVTLTVAVVLAVTTSKALGL